MANAGIGLHQYLLLLQDVLPIHMPVFVLLLLLLHVLAVVLSVVEQHIVKWLV
jgi:hypothetical protein